VSPDPTEPDVSRLTSENIAEVDRYLKKTIQQGMAVQGMAVIRWMSSHLNQVREHQGLVTAYIISDSGKDRQTVALRMTLHNRKMIFIGCFDVSDAAMLATPIYNALRTLTILPV
jgi:hypothetical protein